MNGYICLSAAVAVLVFGCTYSPAEGVEPGDAGAQDAAVRTLEDVERYPCESLHRVERCNETGLLYAAFCYPDGPGPDPLPELAGYYPSYGCAAPAEYNSGRGAEWVFWCCSKVFRGPRR